MRLVHFITNHSLTKLKPISIPGTTLLLPIYYDGSLNHNQLNTTNWALSMTSDKTYNRESLSAFKPKTVVLSAFLFARDKSMKDVVDMAEELNHSYRLVVDISYLNPNERLYLHNSPNENWRYIGISMDDPYAREAQSLYWSRFAAIKRIIG